MADENKEKPNLVLLSSKRLEKVQFSIPHDEYQLLSAVDSMLFSLFVGCAQGPIRKDAKKAALGMLVEAEAELNGFEKLANEKKKTVALMNPQPLRDQFEMELQIFLHGIKIRKESLSFLRKYVHAN